MAVTEFTLPQRYKTDQRGPVRWILSHTIHNAGWVTLALLCAAGNAALLSVVPVLIGRAFNVVDQPVVDMAQIGQYALIILITQVARFFTQFWRSFGFEMVAQKVERDVRQELYTSLLGKSMTFHNLQPIGDTMARATNDVRQINYLFSPGVNMVVGSLAFLIMPFILAPSYHPALLLAPSIFAVLYVIALWRYLNTLRPITDEVRLSFGELNTRLAEALDGVETVKGASQEQGEVGLFEKNAQRYKNAVVHQGKVEAKFLPMLLLAATLAGGLLHALILYNQGLLDLGQVVGYFGVLAMLDFPTFTSLWAYSQISSGLAGGRRILELMNRENNLDQNLKGCTDALRGEVEFRNVNFGYENSDPSVQDVSFHVYPGQTVAIVGQTGSAKTTLVKLINRTYDVTSGQVLVDGVDVREWNLEALRRSISIIEQDVFLFSRSITENIRFGKPSATQEEVYAAAQAAQADEFIQSFSEKYETVIGERGITLSGGQRQRLALARAFLTDPRILVLDDSTSAIDSATEDKIQRAIYAAAKGRTTFIITHRLSQIRWADLILVMRRGKLSAVGTHDELMRTSEPYRRIFNN
jgi:ATP-binding cassette subfamily B protein